MSIAHIISAPASGGAENFVRDLTKAIARRGVKAHIAFLGHGADLGRSQDFERHFLADLASSDVGYVFLGSEARGRPWLGASRLRHFLEEEQITIVHSHLAFGNVFASCQRRPLVYTHHSENRRFSPAWYWFFNRIVDQYIGISSKCADTLRGATGRDVLLLRNGVDPAKFKSRRVKGIHGKVRLVTVGRLHPHKNHNLMIEAVANLPEVLRSQVKLTIIGEGTNEARIALSRRVEELGISAQVTLAGPSSDVPMALNSQDIFLMSSTTEGMPIALIEAAFAGLPCIVTDVGGCREVVESCGNGFVVPLDVAAFTSALIQMLTTSGLIERFSANALERVHEFSIEETADRHMVLYRELAERKS